ncbi:NAD-P-binding protein [Dendrothele bispora CBS 962.96]|uniref:NAD-P-binding protein n=1 Tax=Dendrothele bispora (strain CBS 962.96) TaxID=1314807 RepID=A0A4V4HH63_DENBC|nr:NAD-P-binding protein [Dendrothele bispora CBS 962.96]
MESLHAHTNLPYSRPATPGLHPSQIGFVGIGAMGYFMARNLANRRVIPGFTNSPLLLWNRSPERPQKLVKELGEDRVRITQSLEELVNSCDVVITNLANDAVVKSIYEQFVKTLTQNSPVRSKIFVETSTVGEIDGSLSKIPHTHFITSPVFGTPAVADKAQLVIVMSGDYRSKKEVAYLLVPSVGRKVIDLGENVEKAPTFKLIGNSMILGAIEVFGEAYTLGEKAGIEADRVNDLMAYSDRMAKDSFDGTIGFAIEGGIKDASHIRHLTSTYDSPMPVIDVAHQHLITARAIHNAQKREGKAVVDTLDWSGIIAGSRVAAGLDPFDSKKHQNVVLEDD